MEEITNNEGRSTGRCSLSSTLLLVVLALNLLFSLNPMNINVSALPSNASRLGPKPLLNYQYNTSQATDTPVLLNKCAQSVDNGYTALRMSLRETFHKPTILLESPPNMQGRVTPALQHCLSRPSFEHPGRYMQRAEFCRQIPCIATANVRLVLA